MSVIFEEYSSFENDVRIITDIPEITCTHLEFDTLLSQFYMEFSIDKWSSIQDYDCIHNFLSLIQSRIEIIAIVSEAFMKHLDIGQKMPSATFNICMTLKVHDRAEFFDKINQFAYKKNDELFSKVIEDALAS